MTAAEAVTALIGMGEGAFVAAFAVFLRVGAAMAFLPAFGERSVPVRVKLGLAFAFTAICAPAVANLLPPVDGLIGPLIATETVIGLAVGAALRLMVHAIQMAGAMAAQSVSISQILGGQAVDPQPAIGHIMTVAGLALAVMAGLHVKIAQFLIFTYQLMPAGQFPAPDDLLQWGTDRVAKAFGLGFALAAPFVITSVIYNLALGVINRAMPQLMVAFVGAPAITFGGLVILAVSLPTALTIWMSVFDALLLDPAGALR